MIYDQRWFPRATLNKEVGISELSDPIVKFFLQYAYEPWIVYSAIIVLLVASSFGLPFPEEITLLSAGLLAHIAMHPDRYPPPNPDSTGINVILTAVICLLAVFLSDFLVFYLGRRFGTKILQYSFIKRFFSPELNKRINHFTEKYGSWACGIFRFTPGLRFPGHFACGSFGISPLKFTLIDGSAALLTVPTQVIFMAYYGEEILETLKQLKLVIGCLFALAFVIYIFRRWRKSRIESDQGQDSDINKAAS